MNKEKVLRVLIVGSDKVFAIENYYIRYLREFGVKVELFTAFNIFIDYYEKNIFHKVLFKSGFSPIYHNINEQFRAKIEEFNPDIIFVFKGMEIMPASLAWAKDRKIKLVNYNPDNPFVFSGKGSGNRNVTDSIGLYDLHLTYDHDVQKKLKAEYQMNAGILPFGFDDDIDLYNQCIREQELVKLCFLGNPDPKRAAFIEGLATRGIAIDVFGIGWNKFLKHPAIRLFPPALGIETWKTLRRYRVQLNLMRVHNEGSHNMRSFEVPGIGGIMVAPDTTDHREYFQHGKEIFLYKDLEESTEIIKGLLLMDAEQVSTIRRNARHRSETSGYSYRHRSYELLNYFESLQTN